MTGHFYTPHERRQQLMQLGQALENLIPLARRMKLDQRHQYEQALDKTRSLLASGFGAGELAVLAASVPDVFERHRDWQTPYLAEQADGSWRLPDWLEELERYLDPVLKYTYALRSLGCY
ncbi:hypothetical protein [Pseudomonas sp. LP_7_YM]|uniref:hypothetical protein n=1 Tax=Pseudomonas sp. LP_7_YM TaxID=2485137 RepID=UPI00106107A1|nr:hypothetical protein [Pseudomonas sp. LP_7_YM]TDV67623.1 hypothetical protein EC915_103158 [Pseudomonas sp. LP_7_YM]